MPEEASPEILLARAASYANDETSDCEEDGIATIGLEPSSFTPWAGLQDVPPSLNAEGWTSLPTRKYRVWASGDDVGDDDT